MNIGKSYRQHAIPDSWDTIVIGSGLGGLATAGLLARHAGKRVLVLERHYTAGGFTHAFHRAGYEWDVGVHYVGEMHRRGSLLRRLLDHLSDGALDWADMGDVYDTVVIGEDRYELVKGRERFRARLLEYFPSRAADIDRYLERIAGTVRRSRTFFMEKALPRPVAAVAGPAMRWPAMRDARRTVREVMSGLTGDPRLSGVLTAQYGDYGLPPAQASFLMHAILVQHYLGGGAYPVGGASRIAATMLPGIERGGGEVVTSAEVESILFQQGRAAGVRLPDGRELRAPAVVSDAGWAVTFGRLVPRDLAERAGLHATIPGVKPSFAHVALYVGARQDAAALGLGRSNIWVFPDHDHDRNVARYLADPEAPLPVAYLSFPSAKDPDFARRHPGRATVEVVGLAPWEWFARWEDTRWMKRGADYESFKQGLADRLLEALLRQVPALRGAVDHAELSTPLSTRHFAGHPHGEIYGLSHVPARFAARELRPQTAIPGLYLTGADICTAGVGGALMAGVLTASVIARRNLLGAIFGEKRQPAREREAAA